LKTTVVISSICFLLACSSTKKLTTNEVAGKYRYTFFDCGYTLELRKDSTFEYNWETDLVCGKTKGTWQYSSNKITLNSERQHPLDQNSYRLPMEEIRSHDELMIEVIDQSNEGVEFANCILKSGSTTLAETTTNLNGKAELPRIEADSLIISHIELKSIRYPIRNQEIDYYLFEMESNKWYRDFVNEVWVYRENKLYDPSIKKSKLTPKPYYKKIKNNVP